MGKTEFALCIKDAYPNITIWMDGTDVTKAGIKKEVLEFHETNPSSEIIIIVDEIEKADKTATNVFLNIINGGRLTKTTDKDNYKYEGLHVTLVATCNDLDTLRKNQPALVSRMMVIEIQQPDMAEFMAICEVND